MTKIIRYQLGVGKHNKFDANVRRGVYMNKDKDFGRRKPALTYSQFASRNELVSGAKIRYFKTKGYYYSGWAMHPNWNKKLVEEETEVNRTILHFKLNQKKFKIGDSIQARLREATEREMNQAEAERQKSSVDEDSNKKTRVGPGSRGYKPLSHLEEHQKLKQEKIAMNEKVKKRGERPFLPIIFCWKKMEPSTGYPPLKVEIKRDICAH